MSNPIRQFMMNRGRVYIFPTRMGGYLNGLIFLMFLLSIGYSNNLMLIFTLILLGLNLMWVVQTHLQVDRMKLQNIFISDQHALMSAPADIQWESDILEGEDRRLFVITGGLKIPLTILKDSTRNTQGFLVHPRRGEFIWTHLLVVSDRPMGLYRAWKYVRINERSLAYPALLPASPPPPVIGFLKEGEESTGRKGSGEFLQLSAYQNEEVRRISWKHYARTGELLVKEGEEEMRPLACFEFFPGARQEEQLSQIATDLTYCQRQSIPFLLKLPTKILGPGQDKRHLETCLKDLALC